VPTPHYEFIVPDRLIILDHLRHRALLVANAVGGPDGEANHNDAVAAISTLMRQVSELPPLRPPPPGSPDPRIPGPPVTVDLSDSHYAALVTRLKQHIIAGDVFQIVASRTFTMACPDPLAAYAVLRLANPSPYLFYVRGAADTVFGASPETALKVSGTPQRVTIRPIAGTAVRGRGPDGVIDADLDARREAALHLDRKETAEHMMLVDLARNDVARVSVPGTRQVTRLLTVDRYSHVMHLVSEVQGVLAPGYDALHAYAAALNMGTLVGAPKIRAAQILREVEATRRGAYGGAVGYLAHDGSMDTAIVIRAAVVRDGMARVRAGAGIVFDSDPAAEAEETRRKAEAVLRAIAQGTAG
jgi:anthranilate synthase component 1